MTRVYSEDKNKNFFKFSHRIKIGTSHEKQPGTLFCARQSS